jgi:type I restriction enzyme R subunit
MKKALKDYAQRQKGLDDAPVKEKAELFVLLDDAIEQGLAYCQGKGVDWGALLERDEVFKSIRRFKEYVDTLLSQDEWCKESNV